MAVRSSAVCLVLLLASVDFFDFVQGDCKDFDFENGMQTLSKWHKTGHAFDNQPTYGDNAHERDPSIKTNVQGDWWIGTFENRSNQNADAGYMEGDYPIGTLTSPKFLINGSNIDFLFGGGCDAGQIRAELLVNDKVKRVAYADNCRDRMRRRVWNVAEFKNRIGQIRLVDGSRKGHVNFDDLRGDFACVDAETGLLDSHDTTNTGRVEELVVVDDPLYSVNQSNNEANTHDNPITGTEDEYKSVHNSSIPQIQHGPIRIVVHNQSKPQFQERPIKEEEHEADPQSQEGTIDIEKEYKAVDNSSKAQLHDGTVNIEKGEENVPELQDGAINIGKGTLQHERLPGEAKKNPTFSSMSPPNSPRLSKALSTAKILKASAVKLAAKSFQSDSASKSLLPKDDELRNLTCKNYLVEIKTGLPWDNDFLFVSNENYQSTRREMEVKVLDAYEDDKDFRGAFFNKFSSYEEPEGVKAYFVLRFRADGKFLGKLLDKLGQGNVSAAGCYQDIPVNQCPSPCPSTCAPTCQFSCCQPSVYTPVAPKPVYQPVPVPMPPPPPQPVPAMVPSPQVYQQQAPVQVSPTRPPPPAVSSQFPMSQPIRWPGSQCSQGCSPNCAPSCSPTCCLFFNAKRKTAIKKILKKQPLEEEKL